MRARKRFTTRCSTIRIFCRTTYGGFSRLKETRTSPWPRVTSTPRRQSLDLRPAPLGPREQALACPPARRQPGGTAERFQPGARRLVFAIPRSARTNLAGNGNNVARAISASWRARCRQRCRSRSRHCNCWKQPTWSIPGALVGAIKPALWNRHKRTVRLALQLLEQTARKHPEIRPHVGAAAAEALAHESPDVHKFALDLLEKHAAPISADLATALSERLDHVAASQRSRVHKLIATASSGPTKRPRRPSSRLKPKANKRWPSAGVPRLCRRIGATGRRR